MAANMRWEARRRKEALSTRASIQKESARLQAARLRKVSVLLVARRHILSGLDRSLSRSWFVWLVSAKVTLDHVESRLSVT